MTKIELQLIALEGEKIKTENYLCELNVKITNLRKQILNKNYGLKIKK